MMRSPRGRERLLLAVASLLLLGVAGGCQRGTVEPQISPEEVPVVFVELSPEDPEVYVGQAIRLEVFPTDSLGQDLVERRASWSSGDESVATVDDFGLVKAIALGTTRISVEVEGVKASVRLQVLPVPIGRVMLDPNVLELVQGRSIRLGAKAFDILGAEVPVETFNWRSSEEEIATVDGAGEVQALQPGSATIVAEVEGVEGHANVLVVQQPVEALLPTHRRIEILAGRQLQLEVIAVNADGDPIADVRLSWATSDSSVASVDSDGLLRAWRAGEVVLTVSAAALEATVSVEVLPMSILRVELSPSTHSLVTGETIKLEAVAIGADEEPVYSRVIDWGSSDEELATVDGFGKVTALRYGEVTITAAVEDVFASSSLRIQPERSEIRRVELSPWTSHLTAGDRISLHAAAFDNEDNVIEGLPFAWDSSDELVAVVDQDGVVEALAHGTARIEAYYRGMSGSSVIQVEVVDRVEIHFGSPTLFVGEFRTFRTEAFAEDGNEIRGHAVVLTSSDDAVAFVVGENALVAGKAGEATITATILGTSAELRISVVDLRFQQIDVSGSATYGLTLDGRIFHWGPNAWPRVIESDLRFRRISKGPRHLCAIAEGGGAYCMGDGSSGQLGNGGLLSSSDVFLPVSGGHLFREIDVDAIHSCGVTLFGRGYCWGFGTGLGVGESLEDSDSLDFLKHLKNHLVPSPIVGDDVFVSIRTSIGSSCGVTADGRGYCWGMNSAGELGDGSRSWSGSPMLLSGSPLISSIQPGSRTIVHVEIPDPLPPDYEPEGRIESTGHGCAVGIAGEGYCWGANASGELGNGSIIDSLVPMPLSGSARFLLIDVQAREKGSFSCGITTTNAAMCWGANDSFQLGDLTDMASRVPVPVSGGLHFSSISLGDGHACALSLDGLAYCWGYNEGGRLAVQNQFMPPVLHVRTPTLVIGQYPGAAGN